MELSFESYGELMKFWTGKTDGEIEDIFKISDLIERVTLFREVHFEFYYEEYLGFGGEGVCVVGEKDFGLLCIARRGETRYFYSDKRGEFYQEDRILGLLVIGGVETLFEFVEYLKNLSGYSSYVIEWVDEYLSEMCRVFEEYSGSDVRLHISTIDAYPFYIFFDHPKRKGVRGIFTSGLIGMKTGDSIDGTPLRYEMILGGYEGDVGSEEIWFQEIVNELVINEEKLYIGYLTKNIKNLKEINNKYEAVTFAAYSEWEEIGMFDLGDEYLHFIQAIPLTKKELSIYENRGQEAFYEYLFTRKIDVMGYGRLPRWIGLFGMFVLFIVIFIFNVMF